MKEVYIVATDGWYSDQINQFIKTIHEFITITGVLRVSGCWEIPLRIQKLINSKKSVDRFCLPDVVVIAVGAIVKGDTYHFEVLSQSVSDALMRLQLDNGVQIVNQVLNCYSEDQIGPRLDQERAKYISKLIN